MQGGNTMNWIDSKGARMSAWTLLLVMVIYVGVHFILAYPKLVHGWDGIDLSTDTDISIDTGTRETITDTVIIEPGYDVPITDAEGNTIEMEIINVMPTPAGIDQIEVYDSETNESMELEMSNR